MAASVLTGSIPAGSPGTAAASLSWLQLPDFLSREQSPVLNILTVLAAAICAGLIIRAFCKVYYRGLPAGSALIASIIPSSFLTALIMLQSEGWSPLALVGVAALAFIHFRTIVSGTSGLSVVLWTLASGFLIGLGYVWPALVLDALVTLAGFQVLRRRLSRPGYRFILRFDPAAQDAVLAALAPLPSQIISRSEQNGIIDLTLGLGLGDVDMALVDRIAAMPGVHKAVIVSDDDL